MLLAAVLTARWTVSILDTIATLTLPVLVLYCWRGFGISATLENCNEPSSDGHLRFSFIGFALGAI